MREQDPIEAAREVKRTETLLRDARAVLRKLDVLAAQALATEDPGARRHRRPARRLRPAGGPARPPCPGRAAPGPRAVRRLR